MPGYPAFIALIWKIVGLDHYTAVMVVQMFFDVGTCYLVAALARLVLWERAAMAAFLLYALNPFTANYAATPLTEVLAIFFTALALLFTVEALVKDGLRWWIFCGLAIAAGILLRPDAGILLAAIGGYLVIQLFRRTDKHRIITAGVVLVRGFAGSADSVDGAQLARLPRFPAAVPALRQQPLGVRARGIQPLGQNLAGGLRLCGRRLLACAR